MSAPIDPEVIATVTLLPTSEGGRSSPIHCGEYRGVLGIGQENFSCRFCITEQLGLAPGQTGTYGIQFLMPKVSLLHFFKDSTFTLWEGRVIGIGTVIEVVAA